MQLRERREFVEHCGWPIKGEYIDKGISGSKAGRAPRSTSPGLKLPRHWRRRPDDVSRDLMQGGKRFHSLSPEAMAYSISPCDVPHCC